MRRCLDLAAKGVGRVAPNPLVGCVIVRENEVIGEGYHAKFGEQHAEIKALESVKDKSLLKGSTLYVNLEPCNHFGKTPPCTDQIIEAKVARVVIGQRDPNIQVAGQGVEVLKGAGIEVEEEVLAEDNYQLNLRFITFHEKQRPYIILKWAQTKDGFTAKTGEVETAVSNGQSRLIVHRWRSQEQAIMVGTNTALIDDPQLTVRELGGTNPLRVVLDRELKIPTNYHLLSGKVSTIVVNESKSASENNLEHLKLKFDDQLLLNLMSELSSRNIQSVLVEGGAKLHNSFIVQDLWDEARVITSTLIFRSGVKAPDIKGKIHKIEAVEDNSISYIMNMSV